MPEIDELGSKHCYCLISSIALINLCENNVIGPNTLLSAAGVVLGKAHEKCVVLGQLFIGGIIVSQPVAKEV